MEIEFKLQIIHRWRQGGQKVGERESFPRISPHKMGGSGDQFTTNHFNDHGRFQGKFDPNGRIMDVFCQFQGTLSKIFSKFCVNTRLKLRDFSTFLVK
jgi:hypothetical protein